MKTRHSKTGHNGHGQQDAPETLLARVNSTKQLVKSARKHLKLLKLECKHARKALKQAKKAARRARKEAKGLKVLKAKAPASKRNKPTIGRVSNGHAKRAPVIPVSTRPTLPVSHAPAQVSAAAA
ncbi:MAG TPA: hypothetical protein VLT36_10815 [Candidatus Dormibacteraeota bacterium]|nr:hypothetical protein [Candidatus Dormibacteraeota bacterium]